jgi:hypothetical protein
MHLVGSITVCWNQPEGFEIPFDRDIKSAGENGIKKMILEM